MNFIPEKDVDINLIYVLFRILLLSEQMKQV